MADIVDQVGFGGREEVAFPHPSCVSVPACTTQGNVELSIHCFFKILFAFSSYPMNDFRLINFVCRMINTILPLMFNYHRFSISLVI